jgi:hypothetical protein
MRRTLLAALALLILVTAPAAAGYKIEQEISGSEETATIYVDSNRLKIDSGHVVIFDINENLLTMIVPERQAYWSGSPEELVASIRSAMESAMEGMLAQVPEDQREMYREQMQSMGMMLPDESDAQAEEHDVTIAKTDETATIAGYETTLYDISVDGDLVEQVWMADDVPVSKELDLEKFAQYAAAMKKFSGEYAYETSDVYLERMANGYPMRTKPYRMGQAGPTTEVTSLVEMAIPDAAFQVPDGYKQVSLIELQGGMGGPQAGGPPAGGSGGAPPSAPGMP